MNYKEEFYKKYFSTHIIGRKGAPTLVEFRDRAFYWKKWWSGFFPQDKNAHIIDVGCGNGSLVWWLQQRGFKNAEGIDLSDEQVNVAKKMGVRNVHSTDVFTFLSERKEYYDTIVMRDILEHFTKQDIVQILELCYKCLKPRGNIIIQVPNAESPLFGRVRYGDFTHEIAFTDSSLQQVLGVTGYKNIKFYPMERVVLGAKTLILFLLWKLVEQFYRLLIFSETGKKSSIVTGSIIAVAIKPDCRD